MKKTLTTLSMALALSFGCGNQEQPMPDFTTPYGLRIATNGINFIPEELDNKYLSATSCLGYGDERQQKEKTGFVTEIMSSYDYFHCSREVSETGKCAGLYWREIATIQIPAVWDAFAHELMHHLTGQDSNSNDLIRTCGDSIDGIFNKEYWGNPPERR